MFKLPKISLGPRYSPLIGLDITTSSIKLIELAQSGRPVPGRGLRRRADPA